MIRVIIAIIEKDKDKITISVNMSLSFVNEIRKYPITDIRIFNNNSENKYLGRSFKRTDHLIKSFTAKYIAAKTPRRDRIIVKT